LVIINTDHCSSCGSCLDACPTGAIYLVDGRAAVEQSLCRECEACIATCPTEAISLSVPSESVVAPIPVPTLRPKPQVIQVKTESASVFLRSSLLPVVGGALVLARREILPWLADYFLYDLDRRLERRQTIPTRQSTPTSRATVHSRGGGQRQRHRQRGG
jgi:NAD-dependent dihydropyrimidine dehydrogenase PreA subunit